MIYDRPELPNPVSWVQVGQAPHTRIAALSATPQLLDVGGVGAVGGELEIGLAGFFALSALPVFARVSPKMTMKSVRPEPVPQGGKAPWPSGRRRMNGLRQAQPERNLFFVGSIMCF